MKKITLLIEDSKNELAIDAIVSEEDYKTLKKMIGKKEDDPVVLCGFDRKRIRS